MVTYLEVGATRGELPAGYRHLRHRTELGQGRAVFTRVVDGLSSWRMHHIAGLTVTASSSRVTPGATALVSLGWQSLRITAPCRVVYVIDESNQYSFAYGTLPGHPEIGKEAFAVKLDTDGTVFGEIYAFSRPGSLAARLLKPATHLVQDTITRRYLHAMRKLTQGS